MCRRGRLNRLPKRSLTDGCEDRFTEVQGATTTANKPKTRRRNPSPAPAAVSSARRLRSRPGPDGRTVTTTAQMNKGKGAVGASKPPKPVVRPAGGSKPKGGEGLLTQSRIPMNPGGADLGSRSVGITQGGNRGTEAGRVEASSTKSGTTRRAQTLEILFRSGTIYLYYFVPQAAMTP